MALAGTYEHPAKDERLLKKKLKYVKNVVHGFFLFETKVDLRRKACEAV